MSTLQTGPTEFTSKTLVDQAFAWLEEAIIVGTLAPGAKLDEVGLASRFGISRGPVREAIRRLEGKNLAERVPHIGARVAFISHSKLLEILEIREALEGTACRLATERMSIEEIREVQTLLDKHAAQGSLKAGESYYQRPGDYDFHFRIIQGCRNEKLTEMLCEDLYSLLRVCRYRSSSRKGRPKEALREHRQIVAAMMARDAPEAERLMRLHLQNARLAITEESTEPQPSEATVDVAT